MKIKTTLKYPLYIVLPFAISSVCHAEEVTELDTVSVVSTATRTEQPIDGVAASVIVVDAKQIQKMGAQTLKDVFNNTPGLIIQYGTFPASSSASKSSVSIRGVGATGSLWLLDGRRLSGEVKNPYDMDRIPASMIERIEIVKGPMSALYGADAVGGVINIITKKPKQGFQGNVSTRYGANNNGNGAQTQLNANIRGGKGNTRYSFYASKQTTAPYNEVEKTKTGVGNGRHTPSKVPATPSFLNPQGSTGGKPFYLQADGSIKPKPLDPTKLTGDKAAVQAAFTNFRNGVQAKVKDSYDVPVSYREDSNVTTVGGRLETDLNHRLTAGVEVNWFEEDREGTYRAAFHPMGFLPPIGHKTNPIVGHKADGTPISFFDKFKKLKGRIPAFNVPVRSRDANTRFDIGGDIKFDVNDALTLNARLYQSDYEKRNTTTMLKYKDFGYPSEAKSAASGMSANVIITALEANATWALNEDHLLTVGSEMRDEKREATVFSQGPGFDTRNVNYKAVYAQDEWDIGETLHLTIGGRYDKYHQKSYTDGFGKQRASKVDSKATFRLGVIKNLNNNMNLRFNLAQGYRVPDIRELFIQKQTPAGLQLGAQTVDLRFNKKAYDLKPETVNSFEVGFSRHKGKSTYELVAFYNDIGDRIQSLSVDTNKDGSDDYFTFENLSSASTQGLEGRLGYQFNSQLGGSFSWSELHTKNKDTGKELEFNPRRLVAARLDYKANERLKLGSSVSHTGKQFYQRAGKDNKTKGYTLVNVNASYALDQKKNVELFAGVDNIFDTKVDKRIGSNVGPFAFVGIRAKF